MCMIRGRLLETEQSVTDRAMLQNRIFTSDQGATVVWCRAEICADLSSVRIRDSATLTLRLFESFFFFLTNYVNEAKPELDQHFESSHFEQNPTILCHV